MDLERDHSFKGGRKLFVVSMGDLAASGGYYISCAVDRIYANATTITGSIGVFGMIPNIKRAYENLLGVSFDKSQLMNMLVLQMVYFQTQYEIDVTMK